MTVAGDLSPTGARRRRAATGPRISSRLPPPARVTKLTSACASNITSCFPAPYARRPAMGPKMPFATTAGLGQSTAFATWAPIVPIARRGLPKICFPAPYARRPAMGPQITGATTAGLGQSTAFATWAPIVPIARRGLPKVFPTASARATTTASAAAPPSQGGAAALRTSAATTHSATCSTPPSAPTRSRPARSAGLTIETATWMRCRLDAVWTRAPATPSATWSATPTSRLPFVPPCPRAAQTSSMRRAATT